MIYQKKSRGHRTSKIVKSRQSSSNGHLPYHLFILWLSARARAWRGMWICVRSKDAQKQLARTSLSFTVIKLLNINLELLTEKYWIKPIPILLNISLTANNHFWYCCPFFASDFQDLCTIHRTKKDGGGTFYHNTLRTKLSSQSI